MYIKIICINYMRKKQRCAYEHCNKKLKLTDWPCKCQLIFCDIHRPLKNMSVITTLKMIKYC